MKKTLLFVTVLLFTTAFSKNDSDDYVMCKEYSGRKQYSLAIEACTNAMKSATDDVILSNLYWGRGFAYYSSDKFDNAVSDFTKSIELYPKKAAVYSYRGNAYRELKKYNEAILDITKAIELNPNLVSAYADRGMIELLLSRYQDAVKDYTMALKYDPKEYSHYYNRAIAYYYLKDFNKYIDDELKVVELKPDQTDSYYNLASVYSLNNNISESCVWLKKALEKGFVTLTKVKQDKDLDNIRNADCYKNVISEIEEKPQEKLKRQK